MPRATPVPSSEETSVPVKRVRRAPRKRAEVSGVDEQPSQSPVEESEIVVKPRRKAPVRRASTPTEVSSPVTAPVSVAADTSRRNRRGSRLQIVVVLLMLLIGIGGSAAIGLSDTGKIDVAARIQEQGQLVANQTGADVGQGPVTIPVQSTPVSVPNGGLTPAGDAPPPAPPPPVTAATGTATSSGEIASSTDTVNGEVASAEQADTSEGVAEGETEAGP